MPNEGHGKLSIGALSGAVGIKVETIRYYEKTGLIEPPHRTAGGNRVYGREDVRLLSFIRRARELGFPLKDIRELLHLAQLNDPDCARTKEITEIHLVNVRRKISSLKKLERSLNEMAKACTPKEQDACPILAALEA